jgi:hypothetical protein
MTDREAIDRAVELTGVERYRHLCGPANRLPTPNGPAGYIGLMRRIVAHGGHPPVPVDYGTGPAPAPCGACP